jgi:hypothetical protein
LEICVCTAVTDNGIIALLTDNGRREASPLHHLNLYGLIKLTDKALTAVGEHARQLLFFGGYGLDLITLEGAVAVLESCPALQRVDISSCPKIEEEAYRKIASSYINIKF